MKKSLIKLLTIVILIQQSNSLIQYGSLINKIIEISNENNDRFVSNNNQIDLNDCQTVDECKYLFIRYLLHPSISNTQFKQDDDGDQVKYDMNVGGNESGNDNEEIQFMNDLLRHRKSKKPLRWG